MKTDFQQYLATLGSRVPPGPTTAFFDLDRTLIAGYSVTALAFERVRTGSLSLRRILSQAGVFLGYGLGRADYYDLLDATVQDLAGLPEREMLELGHRAFRRRLVGTIYREARSLLEAHRRLGHDLVMVTSATRYQAEPIARELGVGSLYCTELEVRGGRISGRFDPCFGPGKRAAAERHSGAQRRALDDAFFYSDSQDDLPLLEAVGHPVACNAKTPLARLADARGWTRLDFEAVGETAPPIAA